MKKITFFMIILLALSFNSFSQSIIKDTSTTAINLLRFNNEHLKGQFEKIIFEDAPEGFLNHLNNKDFKYFRFQLVDDNQWLVRLNSYMYLKSMTPKGYFNVRGYYFFTDSGELPAFMHYSNSYRTFTEIAYIYSDFNMPINWDDDTPGVIIKYQNGNIVCVKYYY